MLKKTPLLKVIIAYFKALIALFLYSFIYKREKVWLFGGLGGQVYSDNAKVFYEYILKFHPEINAYWIAEKGSPAMSQAKGNVLEKGSIKNYLLYYQSQAVTFSGMINADIAPFLFIFPFARKFYNKPFQVRLNHGTISFKKLNTLKGILQKIRKSTLLSIDLNIAATDLEFEVMSGYMRANTVFLAGSARNDMVMEMAMEPQTIFIAPTHRSWFTNEEGFTESDFYKQYVALLSNDLLLDKLRDNNIKLEFFMHYNMFRYRKYFEFLSNDVVNISGPELNLSQNILGSALMITDYSSICSERYFLKKDVVFFQFDQDRYELEMGAYFDLKNDVFGDVYFNVNSLTERIIFAINNNFTISSKQVEGDKYFVHFKDRDNCKRIFNQIVARLNYVDK